jgi:hypothetical protein
MMDAILSRQLLIQVAYTSILVLYTPIVQIVKTPTDKQYKAKRKQIPNYLVIIVDNLNYITMNTNTVLNKVRELLGMQIELEQRKLEDGVTIVEADSFEAEAEIFIVTEDEQKIALPVGEYKMEDGMLLIVKEEGIIAEVKAEEEAEEEKKEEEEVKEEEAGYEEKEEEMAEDKKPVKKTVESIVKETFFTEIEALKKENEELKAEVELLSKNKTEEVENKEEVVELSDVKTEEVEAATKPITHNPENVEEKEVYKFSSKRRRSTLDSIFEKLNK